jgi:hypothetical protein
MSNVSHLPSILVAIHPKSPAPQAGLFYFRGRYQGVRYAADWLQPGGHSGFLRHFICPGLRGGRQALKKARFFGQISRLSPFNELSFKPFKR